jgi:septal ring factor EnvC (AmiA/AmiB activator)
VKEMPHEEKNSLLKTIQKQAEEIRNLREQVKYMEKKEDQAKQDENSLRDELRNLKQEALKRAGEQSSRLSAPKPLHSSYSQPVSYSQPSPCSHPYSQTIPYGSHAFGK